MGLARLVLVRLRVAWHGGQLMRLSLKRVRVGSMMRLFLVMMDHFLMSWEQILGWRLGKE